MPNTAMTMPQVRNRRRQTLSIVSSTVALTTALSNDSEISRIDSTTTIHSMPSVAVAEPVWFQP